MTCIETGNKAESRFDRCIIATLKHKGIDNYKLYESSEKSNIDEHIDRFLEIDSKKWSFDVKSQKKMNRNDENVMSDKTWVELVNVNGDPGWAYGEETHIAFEVEDGYLIVKRRKLAKLIEEKCKDTTIYRNKPNENYKYYQRYGRKDKIITVPMKDIEQITEAKIKEFYE